MSATFGAQPDAYEVGGVKYISAKLTAMQQFHVLRKLGPVLAKIGPAFLTTPSASTAVMSDIALMGPALEALSEMSEADCDYVLHRCLAVTKRYQDPGVWANIWNEPAKRLMFEDIDLSAMMQITVHVLGESLSGFSQGGLSNTAAAPGQVPNVQSNMSLLPTVKIS